MTVLPINRLFLVGADNGNVVLYAWDASCFTHLVQVIKQMCNRKYENQEACTETTFFLDSLYQWRCSMHTINDLSGQ